MLIFNFVQGLLFFIYFSYCLADSRLLNQYAIIQTHDSVTGEIDERRDHVVADWTRTQKGTIIDQLNCGARALDYRPYLSEKGEIFAHHGPIVIYKSMEQTLRELKKWGKENPTELIIFQVSHCVDARFNNNYYSATCESDVMDLLAKMNVHTVTDCAELETMTMEKALSYGNVLAVFGCSSGYWDPSLTCYTKDYVCYDSWPANTSALAWDRMEKFCESSSSYVPVTNGNFWGFGSNWQSSAESVVLGTLHNSSLVQDEERSNINLWAADQIRAGKWKYLNMVSFDNLCHNGLEIYSAVQEYNKNYGDRKTKL